MFRPRNTTLPLLTIGAIALAAILTRPTTARLAPDGDSETPVPATLAAKPDLSRIFGKIQFVDSFPDYKVKVVTSFPDLKVQQVSSFPNKPGRWQIVTACPDFKIQLVDSFPDFKVKYVTSFPGLR